MLIYLQMIESPEDKLKFEIIYQKYKQRMFAVAYDILRNPEDAEDAVHYAFLKVVENIKKIEEADCLKTKGYVVTIVENRAIDIYRFKKPIRQFLSMKRLWELRLSTTKAMYWLAVSLDSLRGKEVSLSSSIIMAMS